MKLPDNFNIDYYADKYPNDEKKQDKCIKRIVPTVKERGYLTKCDLKKVFIWKSKYRNVRYVKVLSDNCIMEITRTALCSDTPACDRIKVLCRLRGINVPTASAILHWFHEDPYPIWDWRALETIELENKISYKRWHTYVSFCRNVAAQNGVDMRTLDRALWQFSKSKET